MSSTPGSVAEGDLRPELILYYREGCHLCEDLQQQLTELFEPDAFHLTLIDIDESPALRRVYDVRVPVLSLVSLQARLSGQTGAGAVPRDGDVGQADSKLTESASQQELCEHFLDLLAVREALASYNRDLLAACAAPADR